MATGDNLADLIKSELNKKFKKEKIAYYLGDESSPSNVKNWVSTGSDILDLIISNRPNGGLPLSKIVELSGMEGSGKSLIANHVLADAQRRGYVTVLIDTENAFSEEFATAVGLDITKLLYIKETKLERIWDIVETLIDKVNESDQDVKKPVVIVFDSFAASKAENEDKGDYSKEGWNTDKAIITSKAMRKITDKIGTQNTLLLLTNQLRDRLGVTFGDTCVDPFSTYIDIRYSTKYEKVEQTISMADFSKMIVNNKDFNTPNGFDISDYNVEVKTKTHSGKEVYKKIKSFIVKEPVEYYYTDGKIKGTESHRIIERGNIVYLKDHSDFKKVNKPMQVVDIEVEQFHTYLANGRLNHNTTTPGGHAIPFHSSVRIKLKKLGKIEATINKEKLSVGVRVEAKVIKNRLGPPERKCEFHVYYDRGIDNLSSWLDTAVKYELVKQGGAWYTIVDKETGEEIKFQRKDFENKILVEYPHLKDQLYKDFCDEMVMKYRSNELSDEQIEMHNEVE